MGSEWSHPLDLMDFWPQEEVRLAESRGDALGVQGSELGLSVSGHRCYCGEAHWIRVIFIIDIVNRVIPSYEEDNTGEALISNSGIK